MYFIYVCIGRLITVMQRTYIIFIYYVQINNGCIKKPHSFDFEVLQVSCLKTPKKNSNTYDIYFDFVCVKTRGFLIQ